MLLKLDKDLHEKFRTTEILGGKGHGIAWMATNLIPVPMAFCIPTSVCAEYKKNPVGTMNKLLTEIPGMIADFTNEFGYMPLLSVRSGARVSMPGMMDTILNVGLDKNTVQDWRERLGEACAIDSYKRLLVMHGSVVYGIERKKLEHETFEATWEAYKGLVGAATNQVLHEVPDMMRQLLTSIEAVFKSWDNERAKVYRKMNNIPEEWGTAVVIQAMVFGNLNDNSGTGVLFTRNPDTGEKEVLGEFLTNAQGEDVVAGIKTPMKLPEMAKWNDAVYKQLLSVVHQMEVLKKDVQDVEFTIQDGKLYLLQTRNAKRSPRAACKIAVDMIKEGLISEEEALKRVDPRTMDLAFQPQVDPKFKNPAQYTGLPACSGVVTGRPVFSAADAVEAAGKGEKVILVTEETDPDDIAGMFAAVGVITMNGGSTSHAAVVARSMNRCCIVGVGHEPHNFMVEKISMDGSTGRIWFEEVPVIGGACKDAEILRIASTRQGSVIMTNVPTQHYPAICYDLSAQLHYELPGVLLDVMKVAKLCNQLHLLLSPYEAAPEIVKDFMTEAMYKERTEALIGLLEDLDIPFATIGFQMKGKPYQATSTMSSLEELVLLDKSSDVLFVPATNAKPPSVKLKLALERVKKWLINDGVKFKAMNEPGGFAALSVHLHG